MNDRVFVRYGQNPQTGEWVYELVTEEDAQSSEPQQSAWKKIWEARDAYEAALDELILVGGPDLRNTSRYILGR